MKKLLISFVLTLAGFIIRAQEVYHTFEAGATTYSAEFDKWIYDKPIPVHLTFLLQQKILIVNDQKRSTYVLGESFQNEMKEDVGAFGWYAVDEDGTKCAVKIVIYRTQPVRMQISVIYDNSGFYYNGTLENK
jgi:hypothetical protein